MTPPTNPHSPTERDQHSGSPPPTKAPYDITDPNRKKATDVLPPEVIERGAALILRGLRRQRGNDTDSRDVSNVHPPDEGATDTDTP